MEKKTRLDLTQMREIGQNTQNLYRQRYRKRRKTIRERDPFGSRDVLGAIYIRRERFSIKAVFD